VEEQNINEDTPPIDALANIAKRSLRVNGYNAC